MAAIFPTTFSNAFYRKIFQFLLEFHRFFFQRFQLIIHQHWFREWLVAYSMTSHYLNHSDVFPIESIGANSSDFFYETTAIFYEINAFANVIIKMLAICSAFSVLSFVAHEYTDSVLFLWHTGISECHDHVDMIGTCHANGSPHTPGRCWWEANTLIPHSLRENNDWTSDLT